MEREQFRGERSDTDQLALIRAEVEEFDKLGGSVEITGLGHRPPGGVKIAEFGTQPLISDRLVVAVQPIGEPGGAAERPRGEPGMRGVELTGRGEAVGAEVSQRSSIR